ncbi:MAG TPA: family 78 glycoside hydrolase catalytic domain [Terriglobia bacterium]|nr:family 78 glycoside hydrolase catalytic domain [Terriglobia bacterium]
MLDFPKLFFRTLSGILVLAAVAGSLNLWAADERPSAPDDLRCEYLRNPLGLDVRQPRFSWVLGWDGRGEAQTAYQILVAGSRALIDRNQGDQWDTGRVTSEETNQIAYQGKALAIGRTYYWKVRAWDKGGAASNYSDVATFELGPLTRDDWKGQWISGGHELRKELKLPAAVVRARAYVTALGYDVLYVNGRRIGHNVLDPAFTLYPKRVLYSTYDVTGALHAGDNAIGATLGGGWATLSKPHSFKGYYAAPALLLQLDVELEGGRHVSLSTDGTWKVADGPFVSDSVYDGEVYDARRETPGWNQPGLDDSVWHAATVVPGTSGAVSAESMPPIRVVGEITPVSISNPRPGSYVFDMGQNMSGWVRLRVHGPAGTRVQVRFAELLHPDGMINTDSIRMAKSRDIYILRGGRTETYEPHFTYHGFRYVELTGYPGTPGLDTLRARVVHTAVETVGGFSSSNQILDQIQKLIVWSELTNLFSIPTDCDQRDERQGWMGDAQVTGEEAIMNFNMAAFYTNFIRDIHDEQGEDGSVTDTVPSRYGSRPADPAWGTAYPQLVWYMWKYYGDKRVVEENYDGVKRYVEFLRSRAQNNILSYSYYGDWVSIVQTPGAFVSAAYYYYDVELLSRMAAALGHSEDAQAYHQLAGQIRDAINQKFYDASTGNYATGTQTANAMALELGLAPDQARGRVAGNLTRDIVYTHNTHLTTGFIGVKFIMPALTELGRSDLAYELAEQTTYPSWGNMIRQGATTLWELWQNKTGPSMNSQDHAMFGSVGAWFYQTLAGIQMPEESAGYRHIVIAPQIVEDLRTASASTQTLRGTVASSWTHDPGRITLEVTIPAGSDARIVIPREDQMTSVTVEESGHTIWSDGRYTPGDPGITGASEDRRGDVVVDTGSGHYWFVLTGE